MSGAESKKSLDLPLVRLQPGCTVDDDDWPEPSQLPPVLHPVAELDPDILPSGVRPYVIDCAERMQCPIDYLGVASLVCLGAVLGRGATICPKQYDEDWLVVPNLWGAAIGPPSVMKSPALRSIVSFVRAVDREEIDAFEARLARHRAEERLAKLELRKAERAAKAAIEEEDREAAIEILEQAASEMSVAPRCRRIECNDATIEAVGELLAASPAGILAFRDELLGLVRSLDKDGWEAARAFYLEAWNGLGCFSYDRIGRGHVRIPSTTVSLLGGVQPGPFRTHVARCLRSPDHADGFLQRFQLLVWPDISSTFRIVDRAVDRTAAESCGAVFAKLNATRRQFEDVVLDGEEDHAPEPHHLDGAAQARFFNWWEQHELRLRRGEEGEHFVSHLTKYRKLVPAVALIEHLAGDGEVGQAVALPSIEKAIVLADYLESHARRAYGAGAQPGAEAARGILGKIRSGELSNPFNLRDAYRHGWSGLNKEQLEAGVELLEEYGWCAVIQKSEGPGRPARHVQLNPKVQLEADLENAQAPDSPTAKTDRTSGKGVSSVLSVPRPGPDADSRADENESSDRERFSI